VGVDLTNEEIINIAEYGKSIFIKPSRIAIVAPQDLAYGLSRMFGVYRDQESHSSAGVFRNKKEAMEWLKKQPLA
jgi:uncharacterized protein (DUF169 family)